MYAEESRQQEEGGEAFSGLARNSAMSRDAKRTKPQPGRSPQWALYCPGNSAPEKSPSQSYPISASSTGKGLAVTW